MELTKQEYFFYEWLIIEKMITAENFEKLTNEEFEKLKVEYSKLKKSFKCV